MFGLGAQSQLWTTAFKHRTLVAFVAAVTSHLLLISTYWRFETIEVNTSSLDSPLSVSIFKEELKEDAAPPLSDESTIPENLESEDSPPEVLNQELAADSVSSTELITVSESEQPKTTQARIKISTNSKEFRRFLRTETDNHMRKNPGVVGKFNQSFEARPLEQDPEEMSPYHQDSIQKGGNNDYAIKYKGKTTCMVRTLDLLDISASPAYVGKDCTPKKKFDLKLNQPNNGWAER